MTATIAPTSERIWFTYLACVLGIALLVPGGGTPTHAVVAFVLLHLGIGAVVAGSWWLATRRSHDAPRLLRAALAVVGLPIVFSGLCWLLPGVHPEPYEWHFLALDRRLFGTDVGHAATHLPAAGIEALQAIYAAFYGICVASALLAGAGSGRHAFDRAVLRLVGGFLASYLGYLLVPTLAPKVVLAFADEITGVWATPSLRQWIDAGEANPWDCFPSGHTMLTITSLLNLWSWHRRGFRWFLLPCLLLVASTMVLRYHWTIDVVAGALLAWPVARACDWLADRDGWPRPPVTPA